MLKKLVQRNKSSTSFARQKSCSGRCFLSW